MRWGGDFLLFLALVSKWYDVWFFYACGSFFFVTNRWSELAAMPLPALCGTPNGWSM